MGRSPTTTQNVGEGAKNSGGRLYDKFKLIKNTFSVYLDIFNSGLLLIGGQFLLSCPIKTRLGQLGANISPDRSSLTPQVLIGNFLKHNYPLLYELQHINLLCLYLPKEDGVSPDAEYITQIIFSIFLQ